MNKFSILLAIMLIIPFISANGLQITTPQISVNKTLDNSVNVIFSVLNTDSFTFYNITFEDNNIINMTKIPELASGNAINVTATIKANTDFNGSVKLIGFYQAKLGTSNTTKEINVDYNTGVTPCVSSVIKGDSVIWINNANRTIVMKNSESNSEIKTILQNENYTQTFSEPIVLNYYFQWLGFKFTDICTLTVLNDFGYINNPEYDSNLNLTVDVSFEPTTMEATFLETNYTIAVYTSDEGLFLLKNTGSKVAKNIHLDNSWFAFSSNDFDLQPGASKTISYTINPIVHNTNETGKNWEQNIAITGNFDTINQKMDIFVKYADIDSGNYTASDSIIAVIAKYCSENPNVAFCQEDPQVVYVNGSGSGNMTNEQFRAILEYWYTEFEAIKEYNTWAREKIYNMENNLSASAENINQTRLDVENIKVENTGAVSTIYFVIIGISIFIIIAGGAYIIWYVRRNKKNQELRRW